MAAAALLRRIPAARAPPTVFVAARSISDSTAALTIETSVPFTSHLVDPPSRDVTTTPAELVTFFRDMSLMRRMEIAADSLYKAKLIRGFCHLYDGQEAVAVGMEAAITRSDSIITAYRDHCIYLARGGDLVSAFSELMGREAGCSAGRADPCISIRRMPISTAGTASSARRCPSDAASPSLKSTRRRTRPRSRSMVTVRLTRDSSLRLSTFRPSGSCLPYWSARTTIVSSWDGNSGVEGSEEPAYYKRGDYVPGLKVDGMDVLAVKQACKLQKIMLLQMAQLYHGHSMSDPGSTYRTRDEISGVRQERDPIERVRKLLLTHDLATAAELKDMEKEIRKQVDDAIAKAKESSMPDTSELFTNVYKKGFGVESFGPDRKELRASLP
ncbi:unnamed protein product [Miscanthus lutarioriparius]|uniref:Dehydrogenase E1 component domain-containing protein n=1 Tax=Miscanthus lutarioriparius TaxID=422564 RepID=A0A811PCW3_9POAL|nr:unnamed protein product [Miscanthus lutarioriparius]